MSTLGHVVCVDISTETYLRITLDISLHLLVRVRR